MKSHYRTETANGIITLWNDAAGVGLRFTQGDPLAGYNAEAIVTDSAIMQSAAGVELVSKAVEDLTAQAEIDYPNEFRPLDD